MSLLSTLCLQEHMTTHDQIHFHFQCTILAAYTVLQALCFTGLPGMAWILCCPCWPTCIGNCWHRSHACTDSVLLDWTFFVSLPKARFTLELEDRYNSFHSSACGCTPALRGNSQHNGTSCSPLPPASFSCDMNDSNSDIVMHAGQHVCKVQAEQSRMALH